MDRPINMSVKEYLMRVQSLNANIPLKTIEAVIENQFSEANKALRDNNTVEISGFGKFIFNTKKAEKKKIAVKLSKEQLLLELQNPNLTEAKKESLEYRLRMIEFFETNIKPKINELTTDHRGVQEQVDSSQGDESSDRGGIQSEEDNM